MKKIVLSIVCAGFLFCQHTLCQTVFFDNSSDIYETNTLFAAARYSAFFPISTNVRRIYGTALNNVELEIGTTLCENSRLWFDAGYIFCNGRSLGLHRGTQMQMVPLALGASYTFCNILPCVDTYLGLGGTYTLIQFRDHSHCGPKNISKKAFGSIVKSGFYYNFSNHLYFNFFFEYLFQRFHFANRKDGPSVRWHNLNMDGIKLGCGIGWSF